MPSSQPLPELEKSRSLTSKDGSGNIDSSRKAASLSFVDDSEDYSYKQTLEPARYFFVIFKLILKVVTVD